VQGWDLRARRTSAGLTAGQVARATGTSETNVAAYERGDKTPGPATLARLLAAVDAGGDSAVFVNRLLTVPATAAAIRKGLRSAWPTSDLLRIVRESRSNAKWVRGADDLEVFFAAPSTTGDRRWDALLAGSTENLALRRKEPAPAWTRGHALSTFWFVGDNRFFDAYALAHSPASLKVRGVMLDPSDLESV
jgi:transcriptional regulator with XRE-family HTH domain